MVLVVGKTDKLEGIVAIPGDKSISHRAIMLAAIAEGKTTITNFLASDDCLNTIVCMRQLGIKIDCDSTTISVHGKGLTGLSEPSTILNVGNSGTTIRLLSGILAGQAFSSFIDGDESIRKRPMARVTQPLSRMGAIIIGRDANNLAPLAFRGGNLKSISYHSKVASAQVKSAILLAGLFAPGWTEVIEPGPSRDHTEIMLTAFGVHLERAGLRVSVKGRQELQACQISVPGDISSAAFLLVAASIVPSSKLVLTNVGLNPRRTGIIDILRLMGANITITNLESKNGEQVGDLIVESRPLKGIKISGEVIVRAIDELPVIAVAAGLASGVTEIRDAEELKVKESNRIAAMVKEFSRLGMEISELTDGVRIVGGKTLQGSTVSSHGDHRMALALAVAGMVAEGETRILNSESITVSYPNFPQELAKLGGNIVAI